MVAADDSASSSPAAQRVVAHLDMDAFYVSVELRRRPELRGLPVIVSGSGPRAVVTTASYEARRFGVGSAMPTSRARRLCPDAVLIAPDFGAYREASQAVMEVVRAAAGGPLQVIGLDEAYLDLSGMLSPRAAMRRLVAEIAARTGLHASVGIGPNKLVAKVASDAEKPRGFVALTAQQARERFAAAPPSLLPGIGPKTAERLQRIGIASIAALTAADRALLVTHFGPRGGPWLGERARFEDAAPVVFEPVARSESCERTFPVDVDDRGEQERILGELCALLSQRLARQGRYGRTVAIKVRLDDFTTVTRARTEPAPVVAGEQIAATARQLLRAYAPPRPVRLLGVKMAGFEAPAGTASASQLTLEL
jgi:DNA polymerase-4